MATLTHEQVANRFKLELAELCKQYNITIISDSDILVEVEPVYDKSRDVYTEFGAEFNIGKRFDRHTADKIKESIEKEVWPSHTR